MQKAVGYYERVLGFRAEAIFGDPPASAVVRRDGSRLLLQETTAPGRHSLRLVAPGFWDAIVFVADLDAVFGQMQASGVRVLRDRFATDLSPAAFEIADHCGNVLCFAQARVSAARRSVARLGRSEPLLRARAGWNARRSAAVERPYLAEFRQFVEGLPDRRDVYWMFFSGGLLHWVAKALTFVPPGVNLALVGSALPPLEREWVRDTVGRPFHHIELPVDDNTMWEFLFAASQHSFGWLDIDCFALNGDLFTEMATIDPDVAVNCVWSYDSGYGFRVANTHFLFVNSAVIRALAEGGARVGPGTYDWRGENRSVAGRRCYTRIPDSRTRKALLKVLPPDERGRPRYPGSYGYFDTLAAYQLVAFAAGYRLHQVRPLDTPLLGPRLDGVPRRQDVSDEAVHVSGVANFHRHFQDPFIRVRYLGAEQVIMGEMAAQLPDTYTARLREVEGELRSLGVEPGQAPHLVRNLVESHWGLSPAGADLLLGSAL